MPGQFFQAEEWWAPADSQLASLEVTLAKVLRTRRPAGVPAEYWRQYVPFIAEGRHLVFVGGFQDYLLDHHRAGHTEAEWQHIWGSSLYRVCDGGAAVFAAVYDADSNRVVLFSYNFPENRLQ
jgi:hypothetical protein